MEPGCWLDPALRQEAAPDNPRDDPERGPRRDVRLVPVKRRAQSAFCAPGLGVGALVGGSAGEAGSLISDPSWPCVARLPCRKSPAKSAKCPCDPSLLPRRFAPLPPPSPPAARGSVSPRTGARRGGSAACSPRGSPRAAPSPSAKSVTAPAGLSRNRPPGKEGRREGGMEGSKAWGGRSGPRTRAGARQCPGQGCRGGE